MKKSVILVAIFALFTSALLAQEPGSVKKVPLAQPEIDRIIKKFTENEGRFRSALGEYNFSRKAIVQTIGMGGQVTGEVMVYQPVTILDISHGGAQIETQFPMQLDSLHDFRLALGPRSIVVKARIAHCHVDQLTESSAIFRSGVEFIEPSDHVREALAAFVAALKAANAAASMVDSGYVGEAGT